MADIVVSRKVFFIGAWRTPNVTDQLLQLISNKMHEKNGYSTDLSLATDGLYLNIHNINGQVTKTDKIPLEIIADFIDNIYDNTCLLAKVKDHRDQFTVFVFLCQNEKDSAAMVQEFQKLKKNLSGEGYNLDMKQSGTNWMLKNKDTDKAIQQPNGDVKLTTATTTVTTTATRISNSSVPDSVSHTSVSSDVRDEINVLAQEVKDIRLMMQKSGGRHHFAKHYGYLHSPPPTQTTINRQVFTDEVFLQPDQVSNEVNMVKRHYTKRGPEHGVVLVRERQGMYKQRQSTSSHFLRSSSQSSLASSVRKRVYPSPAPVTESRYVVPQQRVETMRLISPGQTPAIRKVYTGSASDIVPRNIENVYKSKKIYKRVIPVGSVSSARSEIYDYVQAHQKPVFDDNTYAEPVRSVYMNSVPQRVVKGVTTHIRYEPGDRNLYEDPTFKQQRQDVSNVSTLVNVSSNNILDDSQHVEVNETHVYREAPRSDQVVIIGGNEIQTSANYDEQITSTHRNETQSHNVIMVTQDDENRVKREREEEISTTYRNGTQSENVIVVRSEGNIVQSTKPTVQEEGNVIYVKSEHHQVQAFDDNPRVIGGEVYHVKAKGLEHYDSNYYQATNGNNAVIIDGKNYDDVQKAFTSNVTVISGDVSQGLWGAYAKKPEEYNPGIEIEKEKAYKYTHDTEPASSSNVVVISGDTNQGLWGAYAQKPEPYNSDNEIEKETAYRYRPTHDKAEENRDQEAENGLNNEPHVPEVQHEKKVHYSEDLEQTIEDRIDDRENDIDVAHYAIDAIDNERDVNDETDAEVKHINTKVDDDENNNNGETEAPHIEENSKTDTDMTSVTTENLVMEELREKVSQASESTLLF